MHVTQLKLTNFRRFGELTIPFCNNEAGASRPKTIVFIGNNGAGKTAILDALALNLSWLVARINREKGSGGSLADADILNGKNGSAIDLQIDYNQSTYHWVLSKTRKGRVKSLDSQLSEVTKLAVCFREQLTNDPQASLPLIANYPIERVVLDIPLKIRTRHNFDQLDGYDNSLQQGVDFRRFFEWFRDREDAENEIRSSQMQQQIKELLDQFRTENNLEKIPELFKAIDLLKATARDRQLTAIRIAIKSFMPDFDNLRVQRKPRLQMLIDKNGKALDVGQLSQGEKSLMALVGDIARRLAMMNPALENPLEGSGIVLIDEVDMHLHPNWQRAIIGNLNKTFPNCQFIVTTHSPIVISETPNLLCYALNNGELEVLPNLYGMDVNQVLLQDMDADIRNADIQNALDQLRDNLQDGKLEAAKQLLANLESKIAIDHLELNKARLLIRRLEIQRA
ncbi:AAA family ATPase [Methylobacter sp.]|uniref:AAA family ATPase n=1 Tax=Methylobacter sp. TaxID=2051955 RepID=UPI00248A03EC|nr:AAA family ATPase [Methylobacter sp.]MDI1276783.1 AAA family ATPase [Methylobacter sp.]MDI1357451.1 AAA family ATPase [Methylobacter sp.]